MPNIDANHAAITGVVHITPPRFGDHRGFFAETYSRRVFAGLGVDAEFVQDNHSLSASVGTVRGLHFQAPPHAQAKLVRCGRGAIFDVAVDIRRGSPTYGHWAGYMRDENAVYGGEMSAHHYFRDFVYCDSGMIPWLLVAELVSWHGPLADLVVHRKAAFPSSGEINFTVEDPRAAIARVRSEFEPEAISIDEMDGLGFDMGDWRFNLRSSNTEPVVRLNVEARGDAALVQKGVERVKRALLG
jgi:hypothetical protein